MSIIEGFGDEVLFCLVFTILIGLVVIAWNSTRVRPIFNPSSVWMVHMQTSPERRVLEVYSMDERSSDDVRSHLDGAGPLSISSNDDQSTSSLDVDHSPIVASDTLAIDAGGTIDGTAASDAAVAEQDQTRTQTPQDLPNNPTGGTFSTRLSTTSSGANENSVGGGTGPSDGGGSRVQLFETAVSNGQEEPASVSSSSGANTATIKLKFLDDTQKLVAAWLSQTVGEFKRQHFENDVSEGKVIRLIYRGQLLRDDSRSLASYGLHENCVVHCHVSTTPYEHQRGLDSQRQSGSSSLSSRSLHQQETGSSRGGAGIAALDLGRYLHLIFAFKFAAIWAAWFVFPEYFNRTSFVSLILCSGLFLLFWFGSQRRRHVVVSGDVDRAVGGNGFSSS